MTITPKSARRDGFTFIEALMTIAIMGIMAALIVSAFSNAAADSNRIVSRQQQAAIQSALNSWINGESNRVNVINATTGSAKLRTIEEIRADYNGRLTSLARLNLVAGYLDSVSANMFTSATANAAKIKSDSLISTKQYISMPDWVSDDYPKVLLLAD
jgi:prepilin-type N-terminal cleavage/methylation domain-containing protein